MSMETVSTFADLCFRFMVTGYRHRDHDLGLQA